MGPETIAPPAWRIAGTYLEACNCLAVCPCRRVGGEAIGRATYGWCEGALSWAVQDGQAGDVDLDGLAAVLAFRYEEDEPGSPWDFVLYVDERGDAQQRAALAAILTGTWGGSPLARFPWAFKAHRRLDVRSVPVEVEHRRVRGWFRAGTHVEVRVGDPAAAPGPVTCGIPGHHRAGEEHHAEVLRVSDGPLAFDLDGRCAYQSTFAYSSQAS